jgi:hypothetical protein
MADKKPTSRPKARPAAAAEAIPAAEPKPKQSRVSGWLAELKEAGADQAAAARVLNKVRDDKNATLKDHEDFYRSLAQQSFVWYLEAIRGQPYSAEEMRLLVLNEARKAQA